jgi:hypothetical protein
MTVAIVIGILMASGPGQAPGTAALVAALSEALTPGSSIVVEDATVISDADSLRLERELGAAAVVAVVVPGLANAGAVTFHVRVHVAGGDRWIDRRVTFPPGDTMVERGRTIGLTVASILLSETALFPAAQDRAQDRSQDRAQDRSQDRSIVGTDASVEPPAPATAVAAVPGGPGLSQHSAAVADSGTRSYALELTAVQATGVSGPATGLGGAAHFEMAATAGWWLRIGGGARGGSVAGLGGNDLVAWATIGGAWRLPAVIHGGRFGIGACLDAGFVLHELSHTRAAGTTAYASRLLPQATVLVQGSWRMSSSWTAVAALGSEIAFGVTDVWVASKPVAHIPVVRGLALLGVRFGF